MTPVLEQAPPRRNIVLVRREAPSLTLREIGYGYRPGRSLGLSILAHSLVLLAIVFFGRYVVLQPTIVVNPQLELSRAHDILVLPTLGGGSEGSGRTGGEKGSAEKASSGLRARSQRGFAYPGPQPLVSNPAGATLGIQTILQPSLENLPRTRRYLPLPNIVQPPSSTASELGHAKAALVVKAEKQSYPQPAERPIAAPKITLPVVAHGKIANLVETKPELPQRAAPDPVDASEVPGVRNNQAGLLVLNAVAPPPDVSGKIPRLEARSLFAVAPGETTIIAAPGAGTKAGGMSPMAAGTGSPADNPTGDTLAESPAGGGSTNPSTNQGRVASGAGNGGRYGSGQGSGVNSDSNASGTGRGSSSSPGVGTGSATGHGSGAGAGSAPGGGGFPGISIQGGRYGNGNTGSMMSKAEPRRPTTYNMNIVATASSGGGLPDLGVFHNEKVYTVFLDMRATDEDHAPSWILQYAVQQPPPGDPDANGRTRINGAPTPPYAMLKEIPEFTPELLRKYSHKMILASAVMNTSGKLEQVSIPQNSEDAVVGPLLSALSHWLFQPAQIDGQPVALKVLLGIRFSVPR
ncbi:MAG: hypothetical protein LAO23_03175 [Acidobacteriia bacterium]|nr:hypothetical protein [Terriglobia bacterium]